MSRHPLLLTLFITALFVTESAKAQPNLSKPIAHSTPIAGFYQQAILYPADDWATNQGYFSSKAILIKEHNVTNHYVNNEASLESDSNPNTHRKAAHPLTTEQLSGKIVLVDVSDRVQMELAKNGGKPSPDIAMTDISYSSQATVRVADIAVVADQIEGGVWVVARVGWDQFYFAGTEDWDESEYVDALNHPGFTAESMENLSQIENLEPVSAGSLNWPNLLLLSMYKVAPHS